LDTDHSVNFIFPQITKPFFTALGDEKIQQKILSVLFDLLVGNKNPACAQTISSVFKMVCSFSFFPQNIFK